MKGSGRHMFVSFENATELEEAAVSLVSKGIRRRELVVYASNGGEDDLQQSFEAVAGGELSSEHLVTAPLDQIYAAEEETSPRDALTTSLQAQMDEVRLQDLNGLRVFAVSTPLASFSYWRRWEFEVGRQTANHNVTIICAYDATAVEREMLGDLASFHQDLRSQRPVTSFRLYPTAHGMRLTGEVDAVSAGRLSRVLACVDTASERHLEIDVSDLGFLSHDGLLTIERFARDHHLQVRLVGASGTLRRLHDILGLDNEVLEVKP